jgi:hypothetical protein
MKQTPARLPFAVGHTGLESWLYGIGGTLVALGAAAFGLWRHRLPRPLLREGDRVLGRPLDVLRAAHSGVIGDYVLWITVGTALLGGIWAITLR